MTGAERREQFRSARPTPRSTMQTDVGPRSLLARTLCRPGRYLGDRRPRGRATCVGHRPRPGTGLPARDRVELLAGSLGRRALLAGLVPARLRRRAGPAPSACAARGCHRPAPGQHRGAGGFDAMATTPTRPAPTSPGGGWATALPARSASLLDLATGSTAGGPGRRRLAPRPRLHHRQARCLAVPVRSVRADGAGGWRGPRTVRTVGYRRRHGRSAAAWHRRGPAPTVCCAARTATSRPRYPAVRQASQQRAAASARGVRSVSAVSTRTGMQGSLGRVRGVHSDRWGIHPDRGPGSAGQPVRPCRRSGGRPGGQRTAGGPQRAARRCGRGLQEGLVGAVAAAWVPPAAAGTGDLAARPGPQRRAGPPRRRAGQRRRVLARLDGEVKACAPGKSPEPSGLPQAAKENNDGVNARMAGPIGRTRRFRRAAISCAWSIDYRPALDGNELSLVLPTLVCTGAQRAWGAWCAHAAVWLPSPPSSLRSR
jgi:hypothetical protein